MMLYHKSNYIINASKRTKTMTQLVERWNNHSADWNLKTCISNFSTELFNHFFQYFTLCCVSCFISLFKFFLTRLFMHRFFFLIYSLCTFRLDVIKKIAHFHSLNSRAASFWQLMFTWLTTLILWPAYFFVTRTVCLSGISVTSFSASQTSDTVPALNYTFERTLLLRDSVSMNSMISQCEVNVPQSRFTDVY